MKRRRRRHATRRLVLNGVIAGVEHPRITLAIALIVLAGCALFAALHLQISIESNKLFSSKVPFFRDYLNFIAEFPENEATYIIIEPRAGVPAPATDRWLELADKIAARLRTLPQDVSSVDERMPLDQLGKQGILFDDAAALKTEIQETQTQFIPLARLWGEKPSGLFTYVSGTAYQRFFAGVAGSQDPRAADFAGLVAGGLNQALADPSAPLTVGRQIPDLRALAPSDPETRGYYYVPDQKDLDDHVVPPRHLLLIKVYQRRDFTSLKGAIDIVAGIREAAHAFDADFPEFNVALTGRPVLDTDEMQTTDRDSRRSEIVALTVVFIGLMVMLRSFWLALAAELALAVGIGWTFGYATLAVGRLNLLSTVFLIALIGIGMDYLVQILTRYRQEAARHARPKVIWTAVFRYVGAPITTACLGAASAFFVSIFTNFTGAAELGIIAGGGLLLCLIAGYTVLPALLTIFPAKVGNNAAGRIEADRPLTMHPRRRLFMPLIWILVLVFAAIPFGRRTGFNPNLIDLQAPNLSSVKTIRKLQTWSAAVLSRDLNVLRAARASLQGSSVVSSTDSLLNARDNYETLRSAAPGLTVNWVEPPTVTPADLPNIAKAATTLAEDLAAKSPPTAAAFRELAVKLTAAGDDGATIAQRLSAWQIAFIEEMKSVIAQLHPPPLDIAALPAQLREHYLSADGIFALYVYPTEDLWDHENLARFETDVESRVKTVAPGATITGIASDIYHSTSAIETAFYAATTYALGIIFLLVLFDLRRCDLTLLAVSVLALGLPMLIGLMGLFDISWNFANFFGLPILIGAGHEYGVFMVHRYSEACGDPRRRWRWWDASDRALLLCAYVTTSSFGFFWALGHHKGLKSLGLVMALGTLCIYLAAVLVLRPILRWRLDVLAECKR